MSVLVDAAALLLVRSLVWLMQAAPLSAALLFGKGCTFLLQLPRLGFVARRNMDLVFPERSAAEKQRIIADSFSVLAKNLVSFARIPELNKHNIGELCDVAEALRIMAHLHAQSRDRGVLYLVPHFGCFELLAQIWAIADRPFAVLARSFPLPRLDAWWNSRRALHGNVIFSRKGGYREIMKRLNAGQNVALLFDRNVKKNHAVFVDLLGIPAATTKTFGIVAARTGCPVVFAALVEEKPWKFRLSAKLLDDVSALELPHDEKVLRISQQATKCLEDLVRRYPEQWFWIHRRFKTRPPGDTRKLYAVSPHKEHTGRRMLLRVL